MRHTPAAGSRHPLWFAVPALGLLTLVAVAAVTVGLPAWLLPAGTAVAAAAIVAGIVRYRPQQWRDWMLAGCALALRAGAGLVELLPGEHAPARTGLLLAAQVCTLAVVLRLARAARGGRWNPVDAVQRAFIAGRAQEPVRRWVGLLRGADVFLIVGILAVVTAHLVVAVRDLPSGVPLAAVLAPVVDVVLAGVLLRVLTTRDRMPRSAFSFLLAALAAVAGDLLTVAATGLRGSGPGAAAEAVTVVAVLLFVRAPLDPSMRCAFAVRTALRPRPESARLLALTPLALVPLVLYVVAGQNTAQSAGQSAGQLPGLVHVLAGVLVALVGLVRGAAAVLENERLAERDRSTGLLNRRGMLRAFHDLAPAPDRPWQLALLDLDEFKQINDTFGHQAGDDLVVQVARRLRRQAGPHAVLGRSGGDEFVVMQPAGPDLVEQLRERVFGEPFTVAGHEMPIRASIGVTDLTRPGLDENVVFAEADIAVYAAKAAGRNTVVHYDPKHREQVLGRQQLIDDLRRTLDGDRSTGALQVDYQPLVDLSTDLITGCEALVRWRHAERGTISPDDFLRLAETSGLAGEIDRWVLHQALTQVAVWEAEGIGSLYVSVNLGRTSMLDPQLAEVTLDYLRRTGVRPQQLHLEITEHDELPPEAGATTLALLTEAGVRVSLDDFGIGYTSLSYLHRYPVRELKLDRSITSNLQTSVSSPLLEGIVALARSLAVDVVAEGIETEPQRARLAGLGIAYGQGYHLCRPQPSGAMTALLREAGPTRRIPGQRAESERTVVTLPA